MFSFFNISIHILLKFLIFLFFFFPSLLRDLTEQSVWGRGQSTAGRGGVRQARAAAALQCAPRQGRWVPTSPCHWSSLRLHSSPSWCRLWAAGEFVAQFKFTVLLMANGSHRITSGPFLPELYQSEHEVQDPQLKVESPTSLRCQEHHRLASQNSLWISPRLYSKAPQAVKHRRRRKRR